MDKINFLCIVIEFIETTIVIEFIETTMFFVRGIEALWYNKGIFYLS